MTYLQFHLIWILPALLGCWVLALPTMRKLGQRAWLALWATPGIALLYTTPWDNYLVFREVWGYPPERVLARIGYVPVEEYLFFGLQPLLTGLLTLWCLGRTLRSSQARLEADRGPHRLVGVALALVALTAGVVALRRDSGLYLGLILVWATPVLMGMWLYRGRDIWALRLPVGLSIGLATLYLCIADRWAIQSGIWWISEQWSTGLHIVGLPVEEAVFFLVTNVLVAFSVVLFLEPRRTLGDGPGGSDRI